jgi:hypothetical protein
MWHQGAGFSHPHRSMARRYFVAGDCERITQPVMPKTIGQFELPPQAGTKNGNTALDGVHF